MDTTWPLSNTFNSTPSSESELEDTIRFFCFFNANYSFYLSCSKPVVCVNPVKDRPTSATLASEVCVHKALLRFTQTRQNKPEPTSLHTMPVNMSSLGYISVLVFTDVAAFAFLFVLYFFVCMYVLI